MKQIKLKAHGGFKSGDLVIVTNVVPKTGQPSFSMEYPKLGWTGVLEDYYPADNWNEWSIKWDKIKVNGKLITGNLVYEWQIRKNLDPPMAIAIARAVVELGKA
jgi:hypothetical protein